MSLTQTYSSLLELQSILDSTPQQKEKNIDNFIHENETKRCMVIDNNDTECDKKIEINNPNFTVQVLCTKGGMWINNGIGKHLDSFNSYNIEGGEYELILPPKSEAILIKYPKNNE